MMRSVAATTVLGVDGCRSGWVGALASGRRVRWLCAPTVAGMIDEASVVGIDIMIGLPEAGRREADQAARDRLGAARSSVFYTPARPVLAAGGYPEANQISRTCTGYGLSQQAWRLVPRIRQVDALMTADLQARVIEVHPELSFRALDPRIVHSKRTARGTGQRLRSLAGWVDLSCLGEIPAGVGLDDALDALAVAWSAARWRDGAARMLPHADPPRDSHRLRMEIIT
jgi:predicted RNase H-like nuclease